MSIPNIIAATGSEENFFLRIVAGLPVWAYFAIGAAIIIIACIATGSIIASKKKAKKAAKSTEGEVVETIENPTPVAENATEQAVAADVKGDAEAKPKAEKKPAAKDKKTETVVEKPADKKEAQVAADVKAEPVKEEKPAAKKTAVEKPVAKKTATEKPAAKAETTKKAAETKTTAAKTTAPAKTAAAKTTDAKKPATTAKKPAVKSKAPVSIPASATKKPAAKRITLAEDENAKSFGKYQVFIDNPKSERPYKFRLLANNGQMLFESDSFKIKPNARNIKSFQTHVKEGEFFIEDDTKNDTFFVKLYSKTHNLIGIGETYSSKDACESSIESLKRFAESATVVEDLTVQE